jgi:hypothetical protein
MVTKKTTINCTSLVDIEGVCISYSKESLKLNQDILRRSSTPLSEMKTGKSRKLFDRHTLAYRH